MAPNDGFRTWATGPSSRPQMEQGTAPAPTSFTPGPAVSLPLNIGVHVRPDFDTAELLPSAAADKLRALRQRSSDAHAVTVAFQEISEANAAKIAADNRLTKLKAHPHDGGYNLPDDNGSVITARKTLEKAVDDLKRLNERREARSAAWVAASGALREVETWLRDGRPGNTTLESVESEPPKLVKGETVVDAIERLRRRVRELRADQHRIASSPYPSSYCKQRAREQIEALAARGAPDVGLLVEHDGQIAWPTLQMQSVVHNAGPAAIAFAEVPDTVALFAWLHRDLLIKRLDAEIATESDDAASLSHEARQQREAEVQSDLLAVERDEASLVWSAQSQNLPTEHRSDISPIALLGVTLVVAPADGPRGGSFEHIVEFAQPGRL